MSSARVAIDRLLSGAYFARPVIPFAASPRSVLLPWWAALAARRWLLERGAPLIELRIGGRHAFPTPQALRSLALSPDIRGIWLKVERAAVRGGVATLLNTAQALADLRKAGKLVVAEFDHVGNPEVVLASACDRAWLRPGAQVFAVGLGSTMRFWGDLLSRHGVEFDVEAVGEFKSFGETFARPFASAANREAITTLVGDLQDEVVRFVGSQRPKLGPEGVRALFAEAPVSGERAVEVGLFDGVAYPDEVETAVEALVGKEPRVVPFAAWYKTAQRIRNLEQWIVGRPAIPVVRLEGPVVDGQGQPGMGSIPAGLVVDALDALAEDDKVRAVVLSVQTPGGSAAASDLIWRAVERLRAKKPVVAAFGDVCASGGFYLAAGASEIICPAGAITGSIGVIAGKPVLRPALERHGVHSEDVLASPQADVFAETAFSATSRPKLREGLEATYKMFVDRVATGRKRPASEIEPHARGRVWSGRRANGLGLTDHVGGIELALARAALLAGVTEPRTWDIPVRPRGGMLTRLLRGYAFAMLPELKLLGNIPLTARLLAENPAQAMALLPFEIEVG